MRLGQSSADQSVRRARHAPVNALDLQPSRTPGVLAWLRLRDAKEAADRSAAAL
jgi:hypothetical protein